MAKSPWAPVLIVYLFVLAAALSYLLFALWPPNTAEEGVAAQASPAVVVPAGEMTPEVASDGSARRE